MKTNPSAFWTAVTGALVATINVLALILDWSLDLTAGLNIAASAWVMVLSYLVRVKTVDTEQLQAYSDAVSARG